MVQLFNYMYLKFLHSCQQNKLRASELILVYETSDNSSVENALLIRLEIIFPTHEEPHSISEVFLQNAGCEIIQNIFLIFFLYEKSL